MRPIAFVAMCVVSGACGVDPGHVELDVRGAPAWAIDAAGDAAIFMHVHGVEVIVGESGIPVHVLEPNQLEDGSAWGDYEIHRHIIDVSSLVNADDQPRFLKSVVIAHEIGHAIGMRHIDAEVVSLMLPIITMNQLGTTMNEACPWSNADQAELDRVRGTP